MESIDLRKKHLIQYIQTLQDEAALKKHERLMRRERIKAYEASLKPMTQKELEEQILAAEEDFKAGRCIDIEDLIKEMETW